ncbi:MAG: PepSY domain-containing protein, partial [Thermoplasmatota archaeon]
MKNRMLVNVAIIAIVSMFLVTTALSAAVIGDGEIQNFDTELMDDEEYDDEEEDDSIPNSDQLIGHEEALSIAFERYNGTLVDLELDEEEYENYTYEIDIIGDGDEQEIAIDAYTGEELDFEVTEYDGDLNPDWDQLIGHEEALDIAYQRVDGILVGFELEKENGNYTYEIEIVENQREYELELDAYTGDVLESEVDDPEESRRERGIGRSWDGTQGGFISFDLLEDGISNYTLRTNSTNLLLFESVVIQNLTIEETEIEGARYEIEGDDTEISIYDVAPALMKIDLESEEDEKENEPARVSFDLGDLKVGEQEGPNLNLSFGNRTAKLLSISRGDGPWDESLDIDVNEGFVNYTFEEDMFLLFRMTDNETKESENEREREREREMMEWNVLKGISQGEVGGEVIVDRDEHGLSETSVNYT